jgi:hypothetical protein
MFLEPLVGASPHRLFQNLPDKEHREYEDLRGI